jgi:exodeoxyribonuclease VII, small subunit
MAQKKDDVTFEAAILRLEEIVRALETGNAPLDMSLSLFEEGVSLVKLCNNKLDTAEQRVKILTASSDESEMAEKDYNLDSRTQGQQ